MATSKHPEMEHRTGAVNQFARDNPLTGSALQALVRGWIAGTAGLPGDMEGLARKGINYSFGPGGVNVNPDSALPTTDFYKEWLPGKQVGDENVTEVGSLFGGVGATKPVSLAKGALTRVAQAAPGPLAGTRAAMKGVIKAPGGNWLGGSVEDALKGLKKPTGEFLAYEQNTEPLNQFIDKQLTRYVKNDMATERDPIRALAERGTLHADMGPFGPVAGEMVSKLRSDAGFPVGGSGTSDLAKTWENVSDAMMRQKPASYYQQGIGEVDGWLKKVTPETKINQVKDNGMTSNLGFDHLIDELRNATNPQSGLPANLLLKPESLDRVSVPQAVEHVAKINQWREAQKIEASQALANNPAAHLFKEYPHSDAMPNPKGLRWVELKQPALPDGLRQQKDVLGVDEIRDAADNYIAQVGTHKDPRTGALRDALKYEGDTMGHCVGGYCDDVASGKSRIFSLRDAKGQPHVTIEAAPTPARTWNDATAHLDKATSNALFDQFQAAGGARRNNPEGHIEFLKSVGQWNEEVPNRIIQIKGKSNKKPNDEYLPFVQDFVKSGKWSDVGDLGNTGLVHADSAIPWPKHYGIEDVDKVKSGLGGYSLRKHLEEIDSKYTTPEAFHEWLGTKGYATGGSVYTIGGPDGGTYGSSDEQPTKTALPTLTLEDFRKRISPNMLDAEGKFKAPAAGVNYMLEGMTPEQAYSSAQAQPRYNGDGEWVADYQNPARAQMLDPSWRPGPDNGGGFLGGLGRAAQGMFDGIRTNPAIMAALTAGVGWSLNPAISEGLQFAGMSANAANTAAPMVLNAGKTVLSGGSLADAAKGAAVGYAGGEMGGAVKDTTGSDFMGNAARTLTQTALNGGSLSIDELAAQYASGKLTDLSGLPPQVASIVVSLARNRKTTPGAMVGALSQVARKAS